MAELLLLRYRDHCELTLMVNGLRAETRLFDLDDGVAWQRAASNQRHVLEIQGWADGRRLSGVRWRGATENGAK